MINFTAVIYLAIFAQERPREYNAAPERLAVVAVAAERTQAALLPKWRHSPAQFAGALTSAIIHESGLDAKVHSGENHRNGHCLTQIHHTNRIWERVGAPSYDALLGTDLQATIWCLSTGALSLIYGVNHCHKRHYFTHWQRAMWTMYATGHRCAPWSRQSNKRTYLQNKIAHTKWVPTIEHHRLIQDVLIQWARAKIGMAEEI